MTASAPSTESSTPTAPAKARGSKSAEAPLQDVKYTGQASLRTISAQEWLQLGIEHEAVEWNFHNNFRVPVEDLTDGAVAYLIKRDGRFELVDAEVEE